MNKPGLDRNLPIGDGWDRLSSRSSRSIRRPVAWAIIIVLAVSAIAWNIHTRAIREAGYGQRVVNGPVAVTSAAASKGDIEVTLSALGTVMPLATVTVRTQISGQLTEIAFQEGQMLHQGDFLAQIDPRPYQLVLDQTEGQLQKDQALAKEAEINLARYRKLVAQDSIAKQQLDTQESLSRQYQAAIAVDQAAVDAAKLNLAYCHITAPISGRVGLRQVDAGNYVQTGDANGIVVITQLQPISVLFSLPEDDVPQLTKRLRAGAVLAVTAYDRTETTALATGRLTTLDNEIDPSTGTVKLKAEFPNVDENLFPNQFVNVKLLVEVLHDATVVPTA